MPTTANYSYDSFFQSMNAFLDSLDFLDSLLYRYAAPAPAPAQTQLVSTRSSDHATPPRRALVADEIEINMPQRILPRQTQRQRRGGFKTSGGEGGSGAGSSYERPQDQIFCAKRKHQQGPDTDHDPDDDEWVHATAIPRKRARTAPTTMTSEAQQEDQAAAKYYDRFIASSLRAWSPVDQSPDDEHDDNDDDQDDDDDEPHPDPRGFHAEPYPGETVTEPPVPDETVPQESYEPVPDDEPAAWEQALQREIDEFFGFDTNGDATTTDNGPSRRSDCLYAATSHHQLPRGQISAKRKHDHPSDHYAEPPDRVYGTATSRKKPRTERSWLSEDTNNDGVIASFLVNQPVPDEPAAWELQHASRVQEQQGDSVDDSTYDSNNYNMRRNSRSTANSNHERHEDDSIVMMTSRRRAWMTSPLLSVTVKARNATSDEFSASFLVNEPIPDEPPVWEHQHAAANPDSTVSAEVVNYSVQNARATAKRKNDRRLGHDEIESLHLEVVPSRKKARASVSHFAKVEPIRDSPVIWECKLPVQQEEPIPDGTDIVPKEHNEPVLNEPEVWEFQQEEEIPVEQDELFADELEVWESHPKEVPDEPVPDEAEIWEFRHSW